MRLKTCLTILAGILLSLTSVPSARAQALLPPVFTKAFGAVTIPINGTTTLTFTIKNPNPVALTNVQFVDNLPSGMSWTNFSFGSTSCGVVTISNVVREGPFTLAANSTCQIQLDVTDSVPGDAVNIPSPVTSDNAPDSNQPLAVLA